MSEDRKIDDVAKSTISGFISLDGNVIGDDIQKSKIRLAEDNKGAVVNDVVDKYLKKELTDEYLLQVKKEHGIIAKDIIREIAKRQIEKAIGI